MDAKARQPHDYELAWRPNGKVSTSGRLSGKVCVITGTGGSMGRATAVAFAREGASVVGCDVIVEPAESTVEMVRAAGGEMVSMQPCRLDDPADCQALIELALANYGRIGVLCNIAATAYFNWLEDITDEEWDRARWGEVDLVFYLTRAAWPHLKASGGVVVNMASLNASLSFKTLPSLAHTTNKAGIIGMTRQLAVEGRAHGIRANSISPGLIETGATPRSAQGPRVGGLHARQDAAGSTRSARRSRERRPVPGIGRELVHHWRRHRRRWRDEGLVIARLDPAVHGSGYRGHLGYEQADYDRATKLTEGLDRGHIMTSLARTQYLPHSEQPILRDVPLTGACSIEMSSSNCWIAL